MAKLSRKKGITSQIFHVFILDSSSTIGAGLTGLAYNTASLACRYITAGGTLSGAITLQDITTLGTYEAPTANTNMRFKEVSSASPSQGMYEIHVHNDWMNLSGGNLVIMAAGATNMAPLRLEIDLQADVNLTHIQGDATSTTDLKDFADAGYDPATHKVQGVALVDTTTTNTDMRGTNSAALASVCTETRLSELDAANLPADVAAVKGDTAAILLDTGTDGVVVAAASKTGYSISGTKTTLDALNDITAVAAWSAATRTLTAGTDIVLAKGTGVTGFNDIAAADVKTQVDAALDTAGTELTAIPTTTGTIRQKINYLFQLFRNKRTVTSTTETLYKEDTTTTLGTGTVSDDGTTFTSGEKN